MRTFSLVNAAGETCDITEKTLFYYSVKGLGFQRQTNYRQVGDRWVLVNRKPQQKAISGSVAFVTDDPYLAYFNFVQFLSKEPLSLIYCPNPEGNPLTNPAAVKYAKKVLVNKLEKSEIEKQGHLDCSIEFTPLTPWYKYVGISNGNQAESLKWGITWGIQWGPLDEWGEGIKSDSNMKSPARLVIYGPAINPSWQHYVNGIIVETGKLNTEIRADEYVSIDNSTDPYAIQRRSAITDSVIEDLYNASDFSTERFIDLQNGVNTVSVTSDNVVTPYARLEGYIYYESV